MRTITVSILLLITVSSSAQDSSAILKKAKDASLRTNVISLLDQALVKQVDEKRLAGFAAVIARDSKVGYERTYGFRNLETKAPMTGDSICRLASMTKPVVAITAMTLWEDGKFKLDDPISDVLPEWNDIKVKQGDELVPAEKPITLRMLMTHTSGMDNSEWQTWPGPAAHPHAMTSDQFSRTLAARPLLDQPGTKYRYGWSFTILGRYIEALEGKSLDVLMHERLFGPLKMKDTKFWLENKNDLSRVANEYDIVDGELRPRQVKLRNHLLVVTEPEEWSV